MRTLGDSELAISIYPTFSYNSLGGGGVAKATQSGDVVHLTFDPRTVVIPDVNYSNTTFMGVPMAPPFNISVHPKKLEVGLVHRDGKVIAKVSKAISNAPGLVRTLQGFVDRKTGVAELTFMADFMFTAGPLYKVS